MSTKSNLVHVSFPQRLNTDAPPDTLGPEETNVLRNVMTRRLPVELRPRNGIYMVGSWQSSKNSSNEKFTDGGNQWVPYNAFVSPDSKYLVVGLVLQKSATNPKWAWYDTVEEGQYKLQTDANYYSTDLGGGSYSNTVGYVVLDITSSPSSAPVATTTALDNGSQWNNKAGSAYKYVGKPVYFDNLVFIPTYDYQTVRTKYWMGSGSPNYRLSLSHRPVVVWGGALTTGGGSSTAQLGTTATTVTINLNNGSTIASLTTGTLGTADKYRNWLLRHGSSTAGTNPAFQYQYQISWNTAISGLYLKKPYGNGETTGNCPNLSAAAMDMAVIQHAWNTPLNISCVALWRDRIFGGRAYVSQTISSGAAVQTVPTAVGEFQGEYENGIVWSKPGNWQKWPDQNFLLIGEDGPKNMITALCPLSDGLVIFKRSKMYLLTGYDENSFTVQNISEVIGCPYPGGYTVYEDTLYFANQDGVYSFSVSGGLKCLTAPTIGKGIAELWNSRPFSRAAGGAEQIFWPSLEVTPDGHLLFACHYPATATDYSYPLVYDIQTGAWAEWSVGDSDPDTPSTNQYQALRLVKAPDGRVFSIHRWFAADVTYMMTPGNAAKYDVIPEQTTDAVKNAPVRAYADIWMTPGPGQTVRLREFQVNHRVHYLNSSAVGGTYTPWTFQVATDPTFDFGSNEIKSLPARYVNSTAYSASVSAEARKPARHYSDRILTAAQYEGQTVRVRLKCSTYQDATSASRMNDFALTGLKALVDSTRVMGVDNSAT